jgi:TonB family protein
VSRLGLHLVRVVALLAAAAAAAATATTATARRVDASDTVPPHLVLDLRLYEARSMRPDFQAMNDLAFFIDTDGSGVTEPQWLATILRKTPDSILATLACETLPVEEGKASFSLSKRSRSFDVTVDVSEFTDKGAFAAKASVALLRGDEVLRRFDREIDLRLGQTYVWGSRELEISASDYLSHFRDFEDTRERGDLYQSLRNYTFFLVVAVTARVADEAPSETVVVTPNDSVDLGKLESPLGIPVEGEVQVELSLDAEGTPTDARVLRSSVPELNPRVLGAAPNWRFPEAAGKKAHLTLHLRATP